MEQKWFNSQVIQSERDFLKAGAILCSWVNITIRSVSYTHLDVYKRQDYDMPEDEKESMPGKYENVSLDDFVEYSKSMFKYWTEDDFASSFRKMLTIEQFRSKEMQNLYQQYLVFGPAEYLKDLFKNMEIKNPEENAVKFYANMFFYYRGV